MLDKQLRRLRNLLSKIEERKMEKVIEAASEITDFYDSNSREAKRFFKRVNDVLKDLNKIEEGLSEIVSQYPDVDVEEIEKRIIESKSVIQSHEVKFNVSLSDDKNGERFVGGVAENITEEVKNAKETNSHEKQLDTSHVKRLKQVEQDYFMFYNFALKDVKNISDTYNSVEFYESEINNAIQKLEKSKNTLAAFIHEFPTVDVSEIQLKITEGRIEIEEHLRNCKQLTEMKEFYEAKIHDFGLLSSFFSNRNVGYGENVKIEETYTYDDTKRILELPDQIDVIKRHKLNYDKSKIHLGDNSFIEEYMDFIDRKIETEKDESKVVNSFLESFFKMQKHMFPEDENLKIIIKYLNNRKEKIDKQRNDSISEIVVSDLHSKNINQVLFTSNEIKPVEELNETDITSVFQIGEPIRCVAFLDNKYRAIYGKYSRAHFVLDGRCYCDSEEFKVEDLDKGYIDFKLVTNGVNYSLSDFASYSSVEKSMELLIDMPPRIKSIEVIVKSDGGDSGTAPEPNLVGIFKIDGSDEDGMELLKRNLKIVKSESLASAKIPERNMHDVILEDEILKFFNDLKFEETFKKVIITSTGYYAIKNSENISIGRGLDVTMLSETNLGCFQQDFSIAQDQIGDQWTGYRIHSRGGKSEISCSKL